MLVALSRSGVQEENISLNLHSHSTDWQRNCIGGDHVFLGSFFHHFPSLARTPRSHRHQNTPPVKPVIRSLTDENTYDEMRRERTSASSRNEPRAFTSIPRTSGISRRVVVDARTATGRLSNSRLVCTSAMVIARHEYPLSLWFPSPTPLISSLQSKTHPHRARQTSLPRPALSTSSTSLQRISCSCSCFAPFLYLKKSKNLYIFFKSEYFSQYITIF